MSTPEPVLTAEKLHDLRRRILANQGEYTKEELHASVKALFGERIAAAQAVATASKKRPSRAIALDDLLPGGDEKKPEINLDDLA